MKKLTVLASTLLVLTWASCAMATIFTLDTYTVNYNSTDPGLVLYANDILGEPATGDLTAGQSYSFDLFTIGTDESYINNDDRQDFDISVDFSFSAPAGMTDSLTGTSDGHGNFISQLFVDGYGSVEWASPVAFTFGNGGLFTMGLSDVTFGTPGSATVVATLDFISDSAPVPEPATLLLLGSGIAGLAFYRRKRK